MRSRHSILHLVVRRDRAEPDVLRWYVRYVWMMPGGATRDAVIASGELPDVPSIDSRSAARRALAAALEQLAD